MRTYAENSFNCEFLCLFLTGKKNKQCIDKCSNSSRVKTEMFLNYVIIKLLNIL